MKLDMTDERVVASVTSIKLLSRGVLTKVFAWKLLILLFFSLFSLSFINTSQPLRILPFKMGSQSGREAVDESLDESSLFAFGNSDSGPIALCVRSGSAPFMAHAIGRWVSTERVSPWPKVAASGDTGAEGKSRMRRLSNLDNVSPLDDPVAHGLQQAAFRSRDFPHEP